MLSARLSSRAVTAEVDARAALISGGYLDIFDGRQPPTADSPVGSATLLVSCKLGTPAFNKGIDGEADLAGAVTGVAVADGKAKWYRFFEPDHVSAVEDGSVGTADANLNLTRVDIVYGGKVSVEAFVLKALKAKAR